MGTPKACKKPLHTSLNRMHTRNSWLRVIPLLSFVTEAQFPGTILDPNADCPAPVPLATSEMCPEYGNYTIFLPEVVTRVNPHFDNYVRDQTIFSYPPDCPNWQGEVVKTSLLPYAKSFTCAYLVWFSYEHGNSLKNNDKCALKKIANSVKPPTLCHSSVTRLFDAVKPNCDAPIFAKKDLNSFNDYAALTTDSNCYLAVGPTTSTEMKKCAVDDATAFCANFPTNICCTSTTNIIPALANVTTTTTKAVAPTVAPAPVVTTTAASAETDGAVKPIFIVVAILAAGLICILVVALLIFGKRNSRTRNQQIESSFQSQPIMKNNGQVSQQKGQVTTYQSQQNSIPTSAVALIDNDDAMVCVFEYQSSLLDEIDLEIGDRVRIIQKFDDGWALGLNLNTDKEGAFPFQCVEPRFSGQRNDSPKRFSSTYIPNNNNIRYE
jgi:hypothetical protein